MNEYTGSSAAPMNHRETPEAPKHTWLIWCAFVGVCLYVIPVIFW